MGATEKGHLFVAWLEELDW